MWLLYTDRTAITTLNLLRKLQLHHKMKQTFHENNQVKNDGRTRKDMIAACI